jgi:hypothetical protein
VGFRIHRLRHRGQNRHQPWLGELRISNNEYFFLNSIEMTGQWFWKDRFDPPRTQAAKIMLSQTYIPDASIRPTTLARQTEGKCLQ